MKICPKCHEEVEDSFEICWNCNYSFPDDKILDMTPAEENDDSGRSIDCLRCQVRMVYSGKYEFHEGMNTGILETCLSYSRIAKHSTYTSARNVAK